MRLHNSGFTMDLTIAILVYDEYFYETYIKELLSSIKHNLKNYKCLLLIDDRKDHSIDLDKLFDLSEFNYEIVKHDSNKGILQSYLSAINNSKTEYLWILDQDDLVSKFDFNNLQVDNLPDFIYFATYTNHKNRCDKDLKTVNHYDVFIFCGIDGFKSKNIKNMINNDQFLLTLRNREERLFIFKNYESKLPAFWNKIINVNFCKNIIKNVDFSKFGKLDTSADVLLSIYLAQHLNKILLTFYDLPYIHDERNLNKYHYLYTDKNGTVPNTHIDDSVTNSWKIVFQNLSDIDEEFKNFRIKKLLNDYTECNIDFNALGIK